MREVVTIQVGQCGNQVANIFWNQLCSEHGIQPDGACQSSADSYDRKDIFFYQAHDNRFVPRSIMVDLEPRVISSILQSSTGNLYNRENIYVSSEGGGAGNNWAYGYSQAKYLENHILDMIEREVEGADNVEALLLCHSIAGGTGSGVGSFLLEKIRDRFGKKMLLTFSVFPNTDDISDVVVQPYNSILTMKRLAQMADCTVYFDNAAVSRIVSDKLNLANPTLAQANQLISCTMAAITSSLRFPHYFFSDFTSIVSAIAPIHGCHFANAGYTPFLSQNVENSRFSRKTDVFDVVRRLLQPKNFLASFLPNKRNSFLSVWAHLRGDVNPSSLQKCFARVRDKKLIDFVPWGPGEFNLTLGDQMHRDKNTPINGVVVGNHTSAASAFQRTIEQYDRLRKRNAFLDQYRKESIFADGLEEFDSSRETIQKVIEEYLAMEEPSYPSIPSKIDF